jgi:hypothetical protein
MKVLPTSIPISKLPQQLPLINQPNKIINNVLEIGLFETKQITSHVSLVKDVKLRALMSLQNTVHYLALKVQFATKITESLSTILNKLQQ